ncbi:peptidylprolyl isomerase [Aneurinibacillus thermoaerophilus]|uniref:peptidylprolyl isomerase n=1 Tax=Aneurinibacillus thermoaerophilus TaxID=143495 RepID=UPI002E1BD627|nr:peptidylprolyl isomerase [Aneurinibacillus thermoaerophilus]
MWPTKTYGRLIAVGVLTLTVLAGCGKNDPVVAKYDNNKEITESAYKNYVEVIKAIDPGMAGVIDAGDKEALTSVLHYQIMSRHIADQVKETDEMKKEANQNFSQFEEFAKQQLAQSEKMDQFYANHKVTEEELKDFFLDQVKMISYFSKDIKEEDKKKEYEQAKKLGYLTQVDVRHILIGTDKRSKAEAKKKAEELVKQLRNGADFAKLAKENTDDPGSKETGGLYQYPMPDGTTLEQTAEPYKRAAMTLPLNKISDPIETKFGYHIMRVEKRKVRTYDEVKKDITYMLAQKKEGEFLTTKVKSIIKEEKIPASMIKEQPKQSAPSAPGQPGQPVPSTPAPNEQPAPVQPNGDQTSQNK